MDTVSPQSPEERLKQAALTTAETGKPPPKTRGPRRAWLIVKRIAIGVFTDGFIHAGNLAYMSLLSIFPFMIVAVAVTRLLGETEGGVETLQALLQTMPSNVADVLRQPIRDVINARTGNLVWIGAFFGLWSAASFIETIRDIIRRAYGVKLQHPFWEYRLWSMGLIIVAVLAIMLSLAASVILSGVQSFITELVPRANEVADLLGLLRVVPALLLFGSLYALFWALTPGRYRTRAFPKWPGAAFVAGWWVFVTASLPWAVSSLASYDLTYGSLAGVAIVLLFFFLVGMGLVVGAELNAALAETPMPTQEDIVAAVHEDKAEAAKAAAEAKVVAAAAGGHGDVMGQLKDPAPVGARQETI